MKRDYVILTIVLTFYLTWVVVSQWSIFSISYSQTEYENRYSLSQYVQGKGSALLLSDGDMYTFAGIRYIQGEDPTKLNFEHTPFVKYLFGLSYILTGKPNWIIVPFFFVAGFSFWFCASTLLKTAWAKWLALGLFLGHSTIYKAIPQTMLDFPMTALLLLTLAISLRLRPNSSTTQFSLFGLSAGLFFLAKYPFPLSIAFIGILLLCMLLRGFPIQKLMMTSVVIVLTYLVGYAAFFMHDHSLIDFIRFEWWRLHWFSGKTDMPKGMIWQSIFQGRYPQWWMPDNSFYTIKHWNYLWPISMTLYILSWFSSKKLLRNPLFPYQLWILIALVAYSFGAAEDRFLIPLIPGFSILGAWYLELLSKKSLAKSAPILLATYLGAAFYYWANKSLAFYTDIGRDFLLIDELVQKNLVLIGARTSFGGVFHGPLWLYLNAPPFIISGGNPQVQTIYWGILILIFLITTYYLVKKIFNSSSALISVLLLSINIIIISRWFTNPVGAFFLIPLFWFTMAEYVKKKNALTLFWHYLVAGAIIQFEMMVGVPLTLLSIGLQFYFWRKDHAHVHWFALIGLCLMISTFVVFDLRNNFLQTKSFVSGAFGSAHETHSYGDMFTFIVQRIDILTRSGLGVFSDRFQAFNFLTLIVFVLFLKTTLNDRKKDLPLLILFYYFIGYYALSLLFRDTLLNHYVWPLVSFPIIAFSYIYSKNQNRFTHAVLGSALFCGLIIGYDQIKFSNSVIGLVEDDWHFLSAAASRVYSRSEEKDIGVFVYAPDVYAYEQKYALKYQASTRLGDVQTHFFEKRPITYLLIAPPSGLGTEVTSEEWKQSKLKITKKPDQVITLDAGYTLEKYKFSDQEMSQSPDPDVNNWIHFR